MKQLKLLIIISQSGFVLPAQMQQLDETVQGIISGGASP